MTADTSGRGRGSFWYKEGRGWFSLSSLHALLERYVAAKAKVPVDITKLVAAHLYDGRMTTNVAEADQLEKDRDFELALMAAGVIPHFFCHLRRKRSRVFRGKIR